MTQQPAAQLRVVIEPATFDRLQPRQPFGPIRLQYGALSDSAEWFPEETWTDFVVVLLSWWFEQFSALRSGDIDQARCRFMEGPFAFTVQVGESGMYVVRCVTGDGASERVIDEWTTSQSVFETSLTAAGIAADAECLRLGWGSPDVDAFRAALKTWTRAVEG